MGQIVKIQKLENLTHDVIRFTLEKPNNITYIAGQAADVSINKEGWQEELRPFTFTSLPEDEYLEFTIKTYTDHKGVTNELRSLKVGDELIIGEVFGEIHYKGEGLFIAGGAGITPFIAILKYLKKNNLIGQSKLLFANKTRKDIILESYFKDLLSDNFINILSKESIEGFENGYINANLIKKYADKNTQFYYLCGPDPMMEAVQKELHSIGVKDSQIVREGF